MSAHIEAAAPPAAASAGPGTAGRSIDLWLRRKRWAMLVIVIAVLTSALLLWIIPIREQQLHNLLHHFNFIPLVTAGVLLGLRGALLTTAFAVAVHVPHIVLTWSRFPVVGLDKVVELAIFSVAGIIAGFFVDGERRQRERLETTKQELESVYRELQQNVEQLRKAERLSAAGQLSAGLAHEIRNPLASIAGAAGILKRGNASPDNRLECLEIIDKESQRLNRLLTSFLEFARPRAPRFQRTDVTEIIDSVVAVTLHSGSMKGIELQRSADAAIPELECDPEQLKQVLLNLLINSIQAMSGTGVLEIRTLTAGERVVILVKDEGCGLAPQLRDRLFDPFFTTRENGTGLGLAVASKITEQHGGSLTAENNPDRGMTFRLELPLRQKSKE